MEVNIPTPNEALTAVLISPEMQAICLERVEMAKALYQAQVTKRTGALAASAYAHTEVGGVRNDRHIGILTVGEGLQYGASHEFGTAGHASAAHDLNRVLEELGST